MIQNARIAGVGVNSEEYHKQTEERGTAKYPMSSSALREFAKCPKRWIRGYQNPESKSTAWGNLLDTRLLTPKQFKDRYAIRPATYFGTDDEEKKWNGNSKSCKKWLADNASKIVVSNAEIADCDMAVARLREDEAICEFLDCSDIQVELRGEWVDDTTGLTVPLKALLDLAPGKESPYMKCLGDLKSTRNASITAWQRWCFQAGYHVQAAYNTDLYVAATGEDRNTFCFIVQENFAPWQTAKRMLSQDFLALGRAEYRRLLSSYCSCLKHARWPDYDETDESVQGWSIVQPEPFMAERAAFAPRFNFEDAEPTEDEPPDEELAEDEGITP